jgi:hypothetical protein
LDKSRKNFCKERHSKRCTRLAGARFRFQMVQWCEGCGGCGRWDRRSLSYRHTDEGALGMLSHCTAKNCNKKAEKQEVMIQGGDRV